MIEESSSGNISHKKRRLLGNPSHVSFNRTLRNAPLCCAHKKNTLAHIRGPKTSIKPMTNSITSYAQTRRIVRNQKSICHGRRISQRNITKHPGSRTNSVIKKVRSFSGTRTTNCPCKKNVTSRPAGVKKRRNGLILQMADIISRRMRNFPSIKTRRTCRLAVSLLPAGGLAPHPAFVVPNHHSSGLLILYLALYRTLSNL